MKIFALNQNNQPVEVDVENGVFKSVKQIDKIDESVKKQYIIPGFIEVHTHGGYGFDVNVKDKQSKLEYLSDLKKYLIDLSLHEGTTSVLGTTLTSSKENLLTTLSHLKSVMDKKSPGANFLGVHFEGPFISVEKKGGHPEDKLIYPSMSAIEEILKPNKDVIKIVTYKIDGVNPEITARIRSYGIVPSVGHCLATDEDAKKHIQYGLTSLTHFNNAMVKFGTEGDSLAKFAISAPNLYIEYINDGIHNNPELAKQVYQSKPKDKLMLITDSIYPKGLEDGTYPGPNWDYIKRDGAIYTPTGTLTGSSYTMHMAFVDWIKKVGSTMHEAVLATSTNQATMLGLKKGKIEVGYDADFILLDEDLKIKEVFVNGQKVQKEIEQPKEVKVEKVKEKKEKKEKGEKDMAKWKIGEKDKLSQKIALKVKEVLEKNPKAKLCLPTGSSPIDVYKYVVELYNRGQVSFKEVETFNLDEYLGIDPETNPLSFRNFMKKHLFNHIDIQKYNFPKEENEYNEKLNQVNQFDLTIVGVGVNGHIAFNEPGTNADTRTNVVTLTQSTIDANFKGLTSYPTTAITMGLKDIIGRSKEIYVIAWGESKLDALKKFKDGKLDNNCPITLLKKHPKVTVFTDQSKVKDRFGWLKAIGRWFTK